MSVDTGYYICRLCGYIHKGKQKPNVCPACGSPETSFIPYKMMAEKKRVNILDFDIHPVMAHFGVGNTLMLGLVLIINYINPMFGGLNFGYGGVLGFLVVFQIFAVSITALAGLLDGKLRYKKLSTPYLRYKIMLGISIIIISILILIFHLLSDSGANQTFFILETVFIIIAVINAGLLGIIGSNLTCNIVPRGKEISEKK